MIVIKKKRTLRKLTGFSCKLIIDCLFTAWLLFYIRNEIASHFGICLLYLYLILIVSCVGNLADREIHSWKITSKIQSAYKLIKCMFCWFLQNWFLNLSKTWLCFESPLFYNMVRWDSNQEIGKHSVSFVEGVKWWLKGFFLCFLSELHSISLNTILLWLFGKYKRFAVDFSEKSVQRPL